MKFEIYRSRSEWRWRLKARNGEPIASGEGYKNKTDCIAAIDLIRSLKTRVAEVVEVEARDPYADYEEPLPEEFHTGLDEPDI